MMGKCYLVFWRQFIDLQIERTHRLCRSSNFNAYTLFTNTLPYKTDCLLSVLTFKIRIPVCGGPNEFVAIFLIRAF